MSPESSARSGKWSGLTLDSTNGLPRKLGFSLKTEYVQSRMDWVHKHYEVLFETDRLFIWREGVRIYAYIHQSLVE